MVQVRSISLAVIFGIAATWAAAQDTTLTVAAVDNPEMRRLQAHSEAFTEQHPEIALQWVLLAEGELRQRVATEIATEGGRFDIVTIGPFETPLWAERGWLSPLKDLPESYDIDDLLPQVRDALSRDGSLFAAPFYAEAAFTMYRTDLFEAAGIEMPDQPDWDFIREAAAQIDGMEEGLHGICLRGAPGWGENVALLSMMAHSYGGRWFDDDWHATLDSDAWSAAITDYVSLLKDHGPADPASNGYTETLDLFAAGHCGIWVDATAAAATLVDPEKSEVADRIGFAMAPGSDGGPAGTWLWSWALAVPAATEDAEAAKTFVAWATSTAYRDIAAERDGWASVPPGTRASLYETEAYLDAAPFAKITRAALEAADPTDPAAEDVPYDGGQYAAIPEFPGIGNAVGDRIAAALRGEIPVDRAIHDAQWVTGKVMDRSRRFSFFGSGGKNGSEGSNAERDGEEEDR